MAIIVKKQLVVLRLYVLLHQVTKAIFKYRFSVMAIFFVWNGVLFEASAQSPLTKLTQGLSNSQLFYAPQSLTVITSNLDSFFTQLKHKGIVYQIIQTYPAANLVRLSLSAKTPIATIAQLPSVQMIDVGLRTPKNERGISSFNLAINHVNRVHRNYPNLDGRGLTVSLKENVFDTADIDFKGRFLLNPNSSRELSSHATFMATTIVGAGNSDFTGTGVARNARIQSNNFSTLLPSTAADYQEQQISVENHSYGVGVENYYGAEALAYDLSTRDRPGLVHVFSAGNRGNEASNSGHYRGLQGMSNLTGNFKLAKNVLVVGALDSTGHIAPLSSRGPAYDGRIKPDLVAYGPDGTSGAAALVSGAALLLQQQYKDLTQGNELPSSALIRALLVNGVDDLDEPGPDYNGGYGSLNVFRSVEALRKKRYFTSRLSVGQSLSLPLEIPTGARNLRIALAWNEPPGTAINQGANAPAVIQQIAFSLLLPNGELILPWVLDTAKNNLQQKAIRGQELLNNFKQISLANPPFGSAQIQIKALSLGSGKPSDFQDLFVVYDYDVQNERIWQFPTAIDFIQAGKNNVLRWQGTSEKKQGILSYSLDLGKTWRLIDPAVEVSRQAYNWVAPDTFAQVKFRLQTNTTTIISDSAVLSPQFKLQIGFNCDQDAFLFWRAQSGVRLYQIWGLGQQSLEKIAVTADTFLVIDKQVFPNRYFAVSAISPNGGVPGIRSSALNYATQGVGCYVKNLLAEPLPTQSAIRLELQLGTNYGLAGIVFEKKQGDGFIPFAQSPVQSKLTYFATDNEIRNGVNIYRAKLTLNNGDVVYSPEIEAYALRNQDFFLFPNPVSTQGELLLLADQPSRFDLYDLLGRRQLSLLLAGGLETVPINGLTPGVYLWTASEPTSLRFLAQGRLLVSP